MRVSRVLGIRTAKALRSRAFCIFRIIMFDKLSHTLRKSVWNAIEDFELIVPGDKVMVCLSGGKDSYTMLDMLLHVQKAMKNEIEIVAVNLDQKQPDFPEEVLPKYLSELGVQYRIIERDTYSIVK